MKRKIIKLILILAIPCAITAAGYLLLLEYYKTNIPYGTWINGIYCTGLSYDEVAEKLLESNEYIVSVSVTDISNETYLLKPDSSLYTLSYRDGLEKAVSSYGAAGLFTEKHIDLFPNIHIDKSTWDSYLFAQEPFLSSATPKENHRVTIKETDTGFELIDKCLNILDDSMASDVILDAIMNHKDTVSLTEQNCYYDLPYTDEEKAVITHYENLILFCTQIKLDLTIQGKTAYTVDASVIKDWILEDKAGYITGKGGVYLLDEGKVKEYAKSISKEVTTYWGEPWDFKTHDGSAVQVEAGNYGRSLYINKLSAYLINAFRQGISEDYELEFKFYPESAKEVEYGAGYGDDYIEVDIEGQHIYVYIDGELVLDSPCVTGDVRRHRLTPTGVFYVEYKQRNRTLVGEDYRTPVSYWMHFYNHCGFHDANWRRKFGGEIYINDGSHGCVNMPPAKAKEMYGIVEKNMPVIVY